MNNNLVVGNGIDIAFGGSEYRSDKIIERMKLSAKKGKYDKNVFGNNLSGDEFVKMLENFLGIAKEIVNGAYEQYIDDTKFPETSSAVAAFKQRYTTKKLNNLEDILLEDWLLIVHMFFLKNQDLEEVRKSVVQGFEQVLLDAIYNDGQIQDIYKSLSQTVRDYFKSFDTIFTLNYDNNLEQLTGKQVYHLHGDFSELASSENVEYVTGYLRNLENTIVVTDETKHMHCTALFSYSGILKQEHIKKNEIDNQKVWPESLENFQEEVLEKLKTEDVFNFVMAKIENPHLKIATDYHFDIYREIQGTVTVIGMSPNNDEHIMSNIFNNPRIEKVIFYYYTEQEHEQIQNRNTSAIVECRNVGELWCELGVEM